MKPSYYPPLTPRASRWLQNNATRGRLLVAIFALVLFLEFGTCGAGWAAVLTPLLFIFVPLGILWWLGRSVDDLFGCRRR